MKIPKLLLCSLSALAIISCSSSKEQVAVTGEMPERTPTQKVSYGPAGKIIYAEQPVIANTAGEEVENVKAEKEVSKVLEEKREAPVTEKIGKTVSKISAKAGDNYTFLMEQAKTKSLIYKHYERQSDLNEMGNPKTNGLAIAGFVISLVGLVVFGIILGIVAVVFGAISLNSQRRGFAIAALIIGIVDIVGALIVASAL